MKTSRTVKISITESSFVKTFVRQVTQIKIRNKSYSWVNRNVLYGQQKIFTKYTI